MENGGSTSYDYAGAMQTEQYKTLSSMFADLPSKEIVETLYNTKGNVHN
jgi:hypothetical protein